MLWTSRLAKAGSSVVMSSKSTLCVQFRSAFMSEFTALSVSVNLLTASAASVSCDVGFVDFGFDSNWLTPV